MIDLRFKRLDKDLPIPYFAHAGDAGIDLFSSIDCELKPFERKMIPTGIKVSIPEGYAGFVQPRSGLAAKFGIAMVNSPGLIDSCYRGEINVILINLDKENTYFIKKKDKICQLVIKKVEPVKLIEVDDLDETERGENGFGSSGL
jgi:dUTP pyrophosphatase